MSNRSTAWREGYAAFMDGNIRDDNPYAEKTKEAEDWDDGFVQAVYDADEDDLGE